MTSQNTEIIEVEPQGALIRHVIDLGNGSAKRTLGFLPDQGFIDRARRGTLLAAVTNERLDGYVLYDLRNYDVKIVHLCVANHARRQGIARRLVQEIYRRHADRRRVLLSCRYDYEATAVWESLGFRPQATRPGRSQAGHMLTVWVHDFEHPTLFDEYEDHRPIAALDHNVFLDLHMDPRLRPQGEESRYLLDDWIGEYVELCVTDEVFLEIHRHDNAAERATEQSWANLYRNLSKAGDEIDELTEMVAALARKAGAADHRHVARAAIGGATYLVSRDGDLLRAADSIEAELGIRILPPEALIVRLDRQRADSPYRPAALQGTELSQLSPTDDMHEELLASLLNHGTGERRMELGKKLRPILADRGNYDVQVVQAADSRIVAGFARKEEGAELKIPFIRVAPGTAGANVIARQLLFSQRKHAADQGLRTARITDPHISRDIEDALRSEHFTAHHGYWECGIERGLLDAHEVGVAGPLSQKSAIEFEDKHWPAKVTGAGIDTYLVPIRTAFAEALLDPGLAEQSLLPRQIGLGLNREHVYYRSTRNARGICPGARILWYVTGDSPMHAKGTVRAVSQLAEVVIGHPRNLHARFQRFGIYTLEQVLGRRDRKGQVMALRFVNTEVLQRPIGYEELQGLWADAGDRFNAPPSPTLIGEHMFRLLYERSSAYAR